jgi:transcription elongation factor Elf1
VKTSIVARRLRNSVDSGTAPNAIETVVCGKCGQRFAIRQDSGAHDTKLFEKQAAWVQEQLVWDHIQERKHHGTIELPDF